MLNDRDLVVTQKGKKGEDGYRVSSIRVKETIIARLEEVCAKSGRSRNELIGMFLEYALDHLVIEEGESEQ